MIMLANTCIKKHNSMSREKGKIRTMEQNRTRATILATVTVTSSTSRNIENTIEEEELN